MESWCWGERRDLNPRPSVPQLNKEIARLCLSMTYVVVSSACLTLFRGILFPVCSQCCSQFFVGSSNGRPLGSCLWSLRSLPTHQSATRISDSRVGDAASGGGGGFCLSCLVAPNVGVRTRRYGPPGLSRPLSEKPTSQDVSRRVDLDQLHGLR